MPGADPGDPFSDPITESNDRKDGGDAEGAFRILMDLCHADLRCLDAHAHLGNLAFDAWPKIAVRHYEVGFRIGEFSCPTKYFPEASSINFRRSVLYGLGVLRTSASFRLARLGLSRGTIFEGFASRLSS